VKVRSLTLEDFKTLALFALVPFALVFVLDGLSADSVREGEIIEEYEEATVLWATVEWIDEEGELRRANVRLPEMYSGATNVPLVVRGSFASVGDGHLPDIVYLAVAMAGLMLGAIGLALRRKPAKEGMIQVAHTPL
jgi:hypothetical protein